MDYRRAPKCAAFARARWRAPPRVRLRLEAFRALAYMASHCARVTARALEFDVFAFRRNRTLFVAPIASHRHWRAHRVSRSLLDFRALRLTSNPLLGGTRVLLVSVGTHARTARCSSVRNRSPLDHTLNTLTQSLWASRALSSHRMRSSGPAHSIFSRMHSHHIRFACACRGTARFVDGRFTRLGVARFAIRRVRLAMHRTLARIRRLSERSRPLFLVSVFNLFGSHGGT